MEYDKKTEKCGKWDPNTVGTRIWWETLKKKVNMRYAHFMPWNMAKNIQTMENKNCTL